MEDDQRGVESVSALDGLAERVTAGATITEADARLMLASHDQIGRAHV